MRQVDEGTVKIFPRREMIELVVIDGKARGIIARNLVTGEYESYTADAVILATGGYGTAYYLSTMAVNSNATAIWRAHKKGAYFGNPCFVQIHPTCIPRSGDYQSKLTLMSESLRNDGRVWVPKKKDDNRPARDIPEDERDYYLERKYPTFGNMVPRDVASRNAKDVCDEGRGIGDTGLAVYLDFADAIERLGSNTIEERYGNLFEMYKLITDEDAYDVPMRIYPAIHYTMGGIWVDYNLMSTIPGLHVLGEANFSDHGANRLGASALMQGLSDGYFIIPYTIGDYLAGSDLSKVDENHEAFREATNSAKTRDEKLLSINGNKTVKEFHREIGDMLWNFVGMSRNKEGLNQAITEIPKLREEFWQNVKVVGDTNNLNKNLEFAGRVADYMELAELAAHDALNREESCGGHFREESQTKEGEALRDDKNFTYVSAWEYKGNGLTQKWDLHKEEIEFENVTPTQRSYK
jgi:succinate dehydrogenase / fumarate reductase flavoprotein subunit